MKLKRVITIVFLLVLLATIVGCGKENADISGYESETESAMPEDMTIEEVSPNCVKVGPWYQLTGYYLEEYSQEFFLAEGFSNNTKCIALEESDVDMYKGGCVISYEHYAALCKKYDFEQKYTKNNTNYFVMLYKSEYGGMEFQLVDYVENENSASLYYYAYQYDVANIKAVFVTIPTFAAVGCETTLQSCFTKKEISNLEKYGSRNNPDDLMA